MHIVGVSICLTYSTSKNQPRAIAEATWLNQVNKKCFQKTLLKNRVHHDFMLNYPPQCIQLPPSHYLLYLTATCSQPSTNYLLLLPHTQLPTTNYQLPTINCRLLLPKYPSLPSTTTNYLHQLSTTFSKYPTTNYLPSFFKR